MKTPVTRHLMALNIRQEKSTIKEALYDWYEQKQKSYEAWVKVYLVQFNVKEYENLEQQKAWCTMTEIKATPTFLVNGYRLPQAYQINVIKYLLN